VVIASEEKTSINKIEFDFNTLRSASRAKNSYSLKELRKYLNMIILEKK